ncbi:hypothetical protein EOD41_00680 [Mucilaginibacter limnophilus]|uniref:Uncharacterized protein n=1 Tax=Mucilaginibacter limnophilus TaxID=1932778 RepID=A0A437MXV4_9SPHI|nr:hypothetical protein EOD41_00680 [Mucilaginibacter limnophilus]
MKKLISLFNRVTKCTCVTCMCGENCTCGDNCHCRMA